MNVENYFPIQNENIFNRFLLLKYRQNFKLNKCVGKLTNNSNGSVRNILTHIKFYLQNEMLIWNFFKSNSNDYSWKMSQGNR